MKIPNLVIEVYRTPSSVQAFDHNQWDLFIRQARDARMLASLGDYLEEHELLDRVPDKPRTHLEAARTIARKHAADIRWEIHKLRKALKEAQVPLVLLKGAAYSARGLSCGRGRLFQDVDILVPAAALETVEKALNAHDWYVQELDDYDQRYYRTWMHELPPMRHQQRKSQLDVHHRIVPPTAAVNPDPQLIWRATEPVGEDSQVRTLCPQDMVLHSAVHLFHDGEFDHALRDLIDIDRLIKQFLAEGRFSVESLDRRAGELDLDRPWFYARRYLKRVLGTDLGPAPASGKPARFLLYLMDRLFLRGIGNHHHSCRDRLTGLAQLSLYIRAHYLRMPPHLLVPHLLRKSFRESH